MNRRMILAWVIAFLAFGACPSAYGDILAVWLTHRTDTPDSVVVSWGSSEAGNSVVEYGTSASYGEDASIEESVFLHHVSIPVSQRNATYYYRVKTGSQQSDGYSFLGYPTENLKIVIGGNYLGNFSGVLTAMLTRENPHLYASCGDHKNQYDECGEHNPTCTDSYLEWMRVHKNFAANVMYLQIAGNHDRQIGAGPPDDPNGGRAYDTLAQAHRLFYELPDQEWWWDFDIPDFGVRITGPDFAHYNDYGTWKQVTQSFEPGSEQVNWFIAQNDAYPARYPIFLSNSSNQILKDNSANIHTDRPEIRKRLTGGIVVSVDGYHAEYDSSDDTTDVDFYNTSFMKDDFVSEWRDFAYGGASYIVCTVNKAAGKMTVEIKKSEDGTVLFTKQYEGNPNAVTFPGSPIDTTTPPDTACLDISLEGQIVDTGGNAVAGARIVLDGTSHETTSSTDGYFRLDHNCDGTHAEPSAIRPVSSTVSFGRESITFNLPESPAHVTVSVFSVLGREIATLADGYFDAGSHSISTEGLAVAEGLYFVSTVIDEKRTIQPALYSCDHFRPTQQNSPEFAHTSSPAALAKATVSGVLTVSKDGYVTRTVSVSSLTEGALGAIILAYPAAASSLLTNGDFSNDTTGWDFAGDWTLVDEKASISNGTDQRIKQTVTLEPSTTYTVSFDAEVTAGTLTCYLGTYNTQLQAKASGHFSTDLTTEATIEDAIRFYAYSFTGTIDNVVLEKK